MIEISRMCFDKLSMSGVGGSRNKPANSPLKRSAVTPTPLSLSLSKAARDGSA
jgi:hypothetical protein